MMHGPCRAHSHKTSVQKPRRTTNLRPKYMRNERSSGFAASIALIADWDAVFRVSFAARSARRRRRFERNSDAFDHAIVLTAPSMNPHTNVGIGGATSPATEATPLVRNSVKNSENRCAAETLGADISSRYIPARDSHWARLPNSETALVSENPTPQMKLLLWLT